MARKETKPASTPPPSPAPVKVDPLNPPFVCGNCGDGKDHEVLGLMGQHHYAQVLPCNTEIAVTYRHRVRCSCGQVGVKTSYSK